MFWGKYGVLQRVLLHSYKGKDSNRSQKSSRLSKLLNCTFVTGMRLSFHLSNCPYLSTFVSVSVRNVTFEVFIRQDMTEVHNTSLFVCFFSPVVSQRMS